MDTRNALTVHAHLIAIARARIGISTYRGDALLREAPRVFNCFRFTQWLWMSVGVSLPDHQLTWPCAVQVDIESVDIADLVFVPRLDYTLATDDFGHVGIATGKNTIIHATKWKNGVVEDSSSKFIERGCLGIRRIPDCYCRT